MAVPLLSLIIPAHNSEKTFFPLLKSIKNSQFKKFADIEIIVVDDGSKDNTVSLIKKYKKNSRLNLKLFPFKKNVGPAKARNFGAKQAKGRYLVFLDSDVKLKPKTLAKIYTFCQQKKSKAFTGIWHYKQKTKNFFPQFKALRDWTYWFTEKEPNARYYLFSTRIAGIEKKLFQELKGFNQNYPEPTVEDIEFTYRIEKKSKISFCPDFVVDHEFEDFKTLTKKYFKRSRDWIRLYLKRLRFDPVATSKKEALKSVLAGLMAGLFLLALLLHPFFYILSLLCFFYFSCLERQFWQFLINKKGFLFLLKTIPTSIFLYWVINLGSLYGLILYNKNILLKKLKKEKNRFKLKVKK
jgi:glycosyltransferase involved in cell wall biosynthesis